MELSIVKVMIDVIVIVVILNKSNHNDDDDDDNDGDSWKHAENFKRHLRRVSTEPSLHCSPNIWPQLTCTCTCILLGRFLENESVKAHVVHTFCCVCEKLQFIGRHDHYDSLMNIIS